MANIAKELPARVKNIYTFVVIKVMVGFGFLCLFAYAYLMTVLTEQEVEFNQHSEASIARLQEMLVINEAALSGFASLLSVLDPTDMSPVLGYTANMRKTYPQIYMYEAFVGIDPDQQWSFSRKMREAGIKDDYQVYRYVSRKSKTGRPSKPFNYLLDTPVMFPVYFFDPVTSGVESLYGFDMMSIKIMREQLIKALLSGETTGTRPFPLQEGGGKGYVLFKALRKADNVNGSGAPETKVAAIIVKTDSLVNALHAVSPATSIRLVYGDDKNKPTNEILAHESTLPVWTSRTFTKEIKLDKYGQPFSITLSKQGGLYPVHTDLIAAAMVLWVIVFTLYLRTSLARRQAAMQRDEAIIALAKEHDLLEQRVQLRTQQLQKTSDDNKRLASRIVNIQEEHSRHIAQELHDEFGQLLTAIKTSSHLITQLGVADKVLKHAYDIFRYSDELSVRNQDLVQALRPQELDKFGLIVSIQECLERFNFDERGVNIDVQLAENIDELSSPYDIAVYRIIQELINNIVKHAQALNITLFVESVETHVTIRATDDGVGFDTQKLTAGVGNNALADRIDTLNGTLKLTSEIGQGSTVLVTIPLAS